MSNKMHKHQCGNCKAVWEHPKPPIGVDNTKAHECPNCGTEEYWHANENLPVDYPFQGWKSFSHRAKHTCHDFYQKNKRHCLAATGSLVLISHLWFPEMEIVITVVTGAICVELG